MADRESLSGRESAQPTDGTDAVRVRAVRQDPPRPESDSLEQVEADIASFKAEQKVFACTGIDETGYGDLLDCICRDEDVHPQAICPVHGEVRD